MGVFCGIFGSDYIPSSLSVYFNVHDSITGVTSHTQTFSCIAKF